MRDNNWLLSRLDYIWSSYFSDVAQINPVKIRFGRYSRLRLGSIKYDPSTNISTITITSMFKQESIPIEVVDHTIGHELVHYTQGFSSLYQKTQSYPHAGGVVKKEMESRNMLKLYNAWVKWKCQYRMELKEYYLNIKKLTN